MEEKAESLGSRLLKAFARVPDPRNPSGRRHSLPAILTLAVCGHALQLPQPLRHIPVGLGTRRISPLAGLQGTKTPATSTLHEVFKGLDREVLETAFAALGARGVGR